MSAQRFLCLKKGNYSGCAYSASCLTALLIGKKLFFATKHIEKIKFFPLSNWHFLKHLSSYNIYSYGATCSVMSSPKISKNVPSKIGNCSLSFAALSLRGIKIAEE